MYHPTSTNLLEDFIELYNPASTNVDLTNWKISKGVQFTFPSNTLISAKGYLVVAADRHTFTNKYPTVANFVAGGRCMKPPIVRLNVSDCVSITSMPLFERSAR